MALLKAADDYAVDEFRAFEIDDGLLTKILAGEEYVNGHTAVLGVTGLQINFDQRRGSQSCGDVHK